ncbi:MAG: acylneuraminate cytidylyltransferase [Peptococcaceae bacterium BRH_c4b]|nr:MAG: acylneuraminate cytidylyltransferase [Peptococcaceae bacterium BRH_c4b]
MINGKTVLAIIPARGGSKGVRRKNIREVAGKPLIAWTIEEAQKTKYIDRLILSSEDSEIIDIAKKLWCEAPFTRPVELAMDDTPGINPVLHAVYELPEHYDYVVLLQPTSPLRKVEDINGCLEKCILQKAPACVSVVESPQSPYWMYTLDACNRISAFVNLKQPINRRQDLPVVYALNGAVYVAETEWLKRSNTFISSDTVAYVMPQDRSHDVDTELDLQIVDFLLKSLH